MSKPVFAFLVLHEHPYGREMLRQLLDGGFTPAVIIEEDSQVGDTERQKFLQRIEGHPLAPPIADQVAAHGIPLRTVAAHKSAPILESLDGLALELMLLGGTRIIRGEVLAHPRDGVINSHPGLLPDCRGSASPAWSVLHDIPVGASTHFCDDGIDTGDLLLRRELPVRRGMTYEDLCHGTLVLAGTLMREALEAWEQRRWPELRRPQSDFPSSWPTFKNAPEEVLEQVRTKLARQTYAHYAEGGSSTA
jgi:methionyl-tRNA formyltransferase